MVNPLDQERNKEHTLQSLSFFTSEKKKKDFYPRPSSLSASSKRQPWVFPILNKPAEWAYLFPEQGFFAGKLCVWVQKKAAFPDQDKIPGSLLGDSPLLEKVPVRGFRGLEGKDLLEKIFQMGTKNLVAIRTSQEIVLMPSLQGAALEDEDVTPDFIRRFNENILKPEYKAKAIEFILKLREIGGLEGKAATTISKVRVGFVRLAKCKEKEVIEAAMLSLWEFEHKSRLGVLSPQGEIPRPNSRSGRPSSARATASLEGDFSLQTSSQGALTPVVSGEGLMEAFLDLLEVLASDYFQDLVPETQCVILKAHNSLLESIISCSAQEGKGPAISRMEESRRKEVINQIKKVEALTWKDSYPESAYLVSLILEGSKRIADDVASWEKGARRMVKFCAALKSAYDKDISGVLENLALIVQDVEILKDWYGLVYVVKEMGKAASQDRKHFRKFMQLINDRKIKKGTWELQYAAASALGEVVHHSQESFVRLYALDGYDPEGKREPLEGLWALVCLKDKEEATVLNKALSYFKGSSNEEIEKSRIRYKAAEVLKSLESHKDAAISEKVRFYLGERANLESASCVKQVLSVPFIHPEKKVRELLGLKLPFLQTSHPLSKSPSDNLPSQVKKAATPEPLPSYQEVIATPVSKEPLVLSQADSPQPFPVKKEEFKELSPLPKKPESKKRSSVTAEGNLPPAEQNELLKSKLKNPQTELSLEESITLLTQCIQYGKIEAQKAQGKEAVIFIGNTGAGKSTTINYLYGCTMQLKSVEDLDAELEDIVVVQPPSEGGSLAEVMPIGHTKESKTFMPQIETDSVHSITYCDCPGFIDNRGAEINIANAVNIKNAIFQAKSVTVIILINYHSLRADRARGLSEMLKIASNLFGKAENLDRYKESILIGVTNIPLTMKLDRLKKWIVKDTSPLMEILAERIFIFDPLDRPLEGGFIRADLISRIKSLKPIVNQSKIFSTVLTDTDETKLVRISEQIGQKIQEALRSKDFKQASSHFHRLQELRLIEHVTIERILHTNHQRIERQLQEEKNTIMTHCHFERFTQAETLLQELETALPYFDEEIEEALKLSDLRTYYHDSRQKAEETRRKEEDYKKQLEAAHKQIQEFIKLLDQQKRNTEEQLRTQQQNFAQAMQEMENTIKRTAADYDRMKKEIQQEMQTRLAQKEEELKTAQGQNLQEIQQKLEQERAKLNSEYAQKLQEMETERKRVAAEQQALKQKAAQDLETEKARLQQKIQELEASKQQKLAEQKRQEEEQARIEKAKQEKERLEEIERQKQLEAAASIPPQAFGKKDWEKYFGDVGVEPKLPSNIEQILQSPCPIWPGKKIADTHLLTLIPKTVNGEPLTLDYLGRLVQSPKGGGKSSKYRYYDDDVKNAIGTKAQDRSYWVLLTKDVLPDTRDKSYKDQCGELENWKQKSPAFQAGGIEYPRR